MFEEGYPLRSLTEVEEHVREHKHLPDVPSGAEMKANGVNLAELNMALLRKVEELTLYAIEQDERLRHQSREIQELREHVEAQK